MLTRPETPEAIAESWLTRFEAALSERDEAVLPELFHAESHWRDVVALSRRIRTVNGRGAILDELSALAGAAGMRGISICDDRTPPRAVVRAGVDTVEAIFTFEVDLGRGIGVVRLTADPAAPDVWRAWTLFTALEELRGFGPRVGAARPRGQAQSRDFRGPNWLDLRKQAVAYEDRDPAVLIVGAGQAGLAAAAWLKALDVDALVVDRGARVGDNWRKRYHALTLHNQVQVNHLPFMPFPPTWPTYIPKDKLAGWLESYAESLELNCWTSTEFEGGSYDEEAGRWTVFLRRDGVARELHPRHVVMATGVSGVPNIPDIPSLGDFRGEVLHANRYQDGDAWAGRKVLVLGSGNSGHDIAQDLHGGGAEVTMVQRSPTLVVNIEPSAQLPYALYDEGPSTEDCDLIATSFPLQVQKRSHVRFTEKARALDAALLYGLARRGFKLDFGEDGTGWQFKYLTRGGGYYFNVGCSDLIVSGEVGLVQWADIDRFVAGGAKLRSGQVLAADAVILATGYKGQDYLVRKLFGEVAGERVGPIWGFGVEDELRNMYTRTPQPGLWFIAGSLAQCRIFSKYLGMQIKAVEEGMLA